MDTSQSKEAQLFKILDSIEKSYLPSSPLYKFKYVFYNVVNGPFERPDSFPLELWNKSLQRDQSLMPVLLNENQIRKRITQQNELTTKLNDSRLSVLKKIDGLKVKREMIKNKFEVIVQKYRAVSRQYITGDPSINTLRLQVDALDRERFIIKDSKEELLNYLIKMNEKLKSFEEIVSETLYSVETKKVLSGNLKINSN